MDTLQNATELILNDQSLSPGWKVTVLFLLLCIIALAFVCIKLHSQIGNLYFRHAEQIRKIQQAQAEIIRDQLKRTGRRD